MEWMDCTRLCTKNTWPSREISSVTAARIVSSSNDVTSVLMGWRLRGGVSITEIRRSPESDMYSVRGMGVAVSESTSTDFAIFFSRSLCLTPKRCSSSTINNPSAWNSMSFESRRCVPMTMSTDPS
jgi:hypothetical protein